MGKFIPSNRNQLFLLPPNIDEWLDEDHLARYIADIVEQLDLSLIYKHYSTHGKDAYDPKVMLSLLFYGYATGVFSSRKIERATYDSVAFRFLSANTHPDHDTIATFRKHFLPELSNLFVQILHIAKEMGLLSVGRVSLDGTKVKANASKHKALSYGYASALQEQLEAEVQTLLEKAKQADTEDMPDGMSIPEELTRREERLQKIKEAKATIEARAKERYEQEHAEYKKKVEKREASVKKNGKKPRGKAPKLPQEEPVSKDQVNLTDEESRIMPHSGGGFMQAYNAQASVTHEEHLIVHQHITQHANDKQEIKPTMQWFIQHPKLKPLLLTADAGYFSEANVKECEDAVITPYISFSKEQHNQRLEQRFKGAEPLCENPTSVESMKHRLQTSEGKQIYAQRKATVEPVFGIMKHVMGFRQFMLRGFENVKAEWTLACIAYNLKRMHTPSMR